MLITKCSGVTIPGLWGSVVLVEIALALPTFEDWIRPWLQAVVDADVSDAWVCAYAHCLALMYAVFMMADKPNRADLAARCPRLLSYYHSFWAELCRCALNVCKNKTRPYISFLAINPIDVTRIRLKLRRIFYGRYWDVKICQALFVSVLLQSDPAKICDDATYCMTYLLCLTYHT